MNDTAKSFASATSITDVFDADAESGQFVSVLDIYGDTHKGHLIDVDMRHDRYYVSISCDDGSFRVHVPVENIFSADVAPF